MHVYITGWDYNTPSYGYLDFRYKSLVIETLFHTKLR